MFVVQYTTGPQTCHETLEEAKATPYKWLRIYEVVNGQILQDIYELERVPETDEGSITQQQESLVQVSVAKEADATPQP